MGVIIFITLVILSVLIVRLEPYIDIDRGYCMTKVYLWYTKYHKGEPIRCFIKLFEYGN